MVFWRAEVARQAISAIEYEVWLYLAQFLVHFHGFPLQGIEGPPPIIPHYVYGIEKREQFFQALECMVYEYLVVSLVFQGGDCIWLVVPVVEAVKAGKEAAVVIINYLERKN